MASPLVYHGPGRKAWERKYPTRRSSTTATSSCGVDDDHHLRHRPAYPSRGDVARGARRPHPGSRGRRDRLGGPAPGVRRFLPRRTRVLVSCIRRVQDPGQFCRETRYGQVPGGAAAWVLGHKVDGNPGPSSSARACTRTTPCFHIPRRRVSDEEALMPGRHPADRFTRSACWPGAVRPGRCRGRRGVPGRSGLAAIRRRRAVIAPATSWPSALSDARARGRPKAGSAPNVNG